MRRVVFVVTLMFLGGCGSCAEEKKPEVEPTSNSQTIKTITPKSETGSKRPVQVSEGVDFASILKRDGGPDGG